jgi:erythromycin esterase
MNDKMSLADWVTDNAIAADSLDPQAPLDDLEPLREVIGDARVVGIGESAHYVREFYLLRHRLLRFLAERLGFTVYALEAHAIDAWIQGGPGTAQEVAAGVAFDQGRSREMYEHLEWMRAHNRTATPALRFAGIGVSASGGSPLPALEEVAAYLRRADPDAMALLEQAIRLVRKYHERTTFKALFRYTALDHAVQDALSAALSRLLSRMETTSAYQRGKHRGREHAIALQHLRGAWYLDHFHRNFAGRVSPPSTLTPSTTPSWPSPHCGSWRTEHRTPGSWSPPTTSTSRRPRSSRIAPSDCCQGATTSPRHSETTTWPSPPPATVAAPHA